MDLMEDNENDWQPPLLFGDGLSKINATLSPMIGQGIDWIINQSERYWDNSFLLWFFMLFWPFHMSQYQQQLKGEICPVSNSCLFAFYLNGE